MVCESLKEWSLKGPHVSEHSFSQPEVRPSEGRLLAEQMPGLFGISRPFTTNRQPCFPPAIILTCRLHRERLGFWVGAASEHQEASGCLPAVPEIRSLLPHQLLTGLPDLPPHLLFFFCFCFFFLSETKSRWALKAWRFFCLSFLTGGIASVG